MSLQRARRRGIGGRPGEADTYRRPFVVMVHRVLAKGFARLNGMTLAVKEETALTGLLIDQMRSLLDSRKCPRGAEHFSVHDDRPESSDGVEGKHRPRVDIFVERTGRGPRPRFHFEAKRLTDSGSVADYVGDDGLGCFLSGRYARNDPDAGMLGYVQKDKPEDWAARIEKKLGNERKKHGLPEKGSFWAEHSLDPSLRYSYRTMHTRGARRLDIFHVLLRCT